MQTLPAFDHRPTAPHHPPGDRRWLIGLKFLVQLENVVVLSTHLSEAELAALLDRVRRDATQTVTDHLWRHLDFPSG